MQGKKLINTLSLISILACLVAVYFGIQNTRLKNLNKELIENNNSKNVELYKKELTNIDSVLALGNYSKALELYNNMLKDTVQNDNVDLDFRVAISKRLVELSASNYNKDKKLSNQHQEFNQKASVKIGDSSANLELEQTQLEVKKLKNKLSNLNASGYLTFKTTKGTKLHYIGSVKNSKANGYGIAIFESGSRYEGQWKDNLRHGLGKFYWDDGQVYEGQYKNDKREGHGVYFWDNGEKYIGEWKDDRRNGEGKFYNKRGKLKANGIWENDELIKEY